MQVAAPIGNLWLSIKPADPICFRPLHIMMRRRPRCSVSRFHARRVSSSQNINRRPGPPPLPKTEQQEVDDLIRSKAEKSHNQLLHPDARPRVPPEFEGEQNPVTGEIGGPKREPTKHGDWSQSGRVTDF
jgi:hypothetical protein